MWVLRGFDACFCLILVDKQNLSTILTQESEYEKDNYQFDESLDVRIKIELKSLHFSVFGFSERISERKVTRHV